MRDVTPQTLAIDGTALSAANQRCCHLLGFAIDVVAERPGDQPDTGHRLHGFGIDLIGLTPDTKAAEHRVCTTKPVATRGTSCARTAVSASAPHSIVVTRMMIRFFRVTVVSGSLSPSWRAGHDLVCCARARRIRKSQ